MAYIITSPCQGEMAAECVEVCPVDCIEEGENMFYIDPTVCIDCGACESVCPVNAIFYESDLPETEKKFIQINADFYR